MLNLPISKSPLPSVPNISSNFGGGGASLPSFNSSLGSTGNGGSLLSSVKSVPAVPDIGSLNPSIPSISAPSVPSLPSLDDTSKLTESLPKFDSKLEIPEIETGKLGLLSAKGDLSAFKDKTISSLDGMVPEFSPNQKISQLKGAADSKLSLLNDLKSAAGGALGAAAGAALAGGNLKSIAGAAVGAGVGGIAGNLAQKAGIGGSVAGAIGSAAGALASGGNAKQAIGGAVGNIAGGAVGNLVGATGIGKNISGALGSAAGVAIAGGNLKQAAGSAVGGLAANSLSSKIGAGAVSSAAGAIVGSKLSGGSNSSALIGGLSSGAGALVAQKFSTPTTGASPISQATSMPNIPSNIDITTISKGSASQQSAMQANEARPSTPPVSSPPSSGTATIDKDTGKVVLSNVQPANVTTVTETVIKGGSRTRYADAKDPVTGESVPVPDKVEPPTKTVTTTVINKSTGEVVSNSSETQQITTAQSNAESSNANLPPPAQVVEVQTGPVKVPRPVSELYTIKTDYKGNETLELKLDTNPIIPDGLELISMVGTKDMLTLTYVDGSTTKLYTPNASKEKFGIGKEEDAIAVDTLPNGTTSKWIAFAPDDLSLPEIGDKPYFVKNPDGSVTYTFADGNKATELPANGKSLFTINGISADVDMPSLIQPTSVEMPQSEIDKQKEADKEAYINANYNNDRFTYKKDENGNYVRQKNKLIKSDDGGLLYRDTETNEVVKSDDRKPGRKYKWATEPDGVEIVTQKMIDDQFDKKWNDVTLPYLKSAYAKKISDKYSKINSGDQTKVAEAVDKIHIIEVTRTGYRLQGDSYKVMMVRVYKKVEEVSSAPPAPAVNPALAATPASTPTPQTTPYPGGLSKENFDKLRKYSRLTKKQMHLSTGGMYSSSTSDPTRAKYEAAAKSLDKYTWIYPFEEGWSQDKIDAWTKGSDPYIW